MISFSGNIVSLLNNASIETFNLVKLGTYNSTDFYTNITLSDSVTYLADGKLMSVQPPRLSSVLDRAEYVISFADPLLNLSNLPETLVGKLLEVRLGFVDPATDTPLLSINDTILVYSGIVDACGYSKNTAALGEIVFDVKGSSPMANFDMARTFHTTRDFMSKIAPGDTSFDQVYDGAGAVRMAWGRA